MQNGNGNGDGDGEGGGEKESATKRKKRLSILGEERKKGGFNLMSLVVNVVIAVVVAGVMVYVLAPTKNSLSAIQSSINSNIEQQTGRLNVLDTNQRDILDALEDVNAVEESLSSLESQTATLSAQVTNLEAKVDTTVSDAESKANAIIAAWEAARVVEEVEEEAAADEEVSWRRWTTRFYPDLPPGFDVYVDCDSVKESGTYEVELEVRNDNLVDSDPISFISRIEMSIRPKSDCLVDEGLTGLWFVDPPYREWDSDFIIQDRHEVETCKEIEFDSYHNYTFATLGPGERDRVRLEFELYYEE